MKEDFTMTYYKGIVYLRDGSTRETSPTNNRMQAEQQARMLFEQMDRCAASAAFKPSRHEVVEVR